MTRAILGALLALLLSPVAAIAVDHGPTYTGDHGMTWTPAHRWMIEDRRASAAED